VAQRRKVRIPIALVLALAYLVPTGVLLWALSAVSTHAAEHELDAELSRRLASLAAAAATQVRGNYLTPLAPGDEHVRGYQNTLRKLEAVRAQTGASRIYVFRPDLTNLVDTAGTPIGDKLYHLELDRHELDRMFASRSAVASTLFTGSDGKRYKAGYAVVTVSEDDPEVVAALAVEAPATYFERLESLSAQLRRLALLTLLVYAALSALVAFLISRPIRRLTAAAERIGQGDLEAGIKVRGRDEIAFLAATLDEMRQALRQRNQRLQMMLAGIAHEVRNPLGGIELYAGILRDELAGQPEQLAHVRKIEREIGHLEQVVSDFLEYARRGRPELAPTDLVALLGEVVELCQGEAQGAGVALELDSAGALTTLAEPAQLKRALLNLIRNALQATPRGGTVAVTSRADGDRCLVVVRDTGSGIASEAQEKIFTPFYTTKEKGTGLGLAFVREIVNDHDGQLRLESAPGRGSTFTVTLPRSGT
jgi:signal transduction histidine kinase